MDQGLVLARDRGIVPPKVPVPVRVGVLVKGLVPAPVQQEQAANVQHRELEIVHLHEPEIVPHRALGIVLRLVRENNVLEISAQGIVHLRERGIVLHRAQEIVPRLVRGISEPEIVRLHERGIVLRHVQEIVQEGIVLRLVPGNVLPLVPENGLEIVRPLGQGIALLHVPAVIGVPVAIEVPVDRQVQRVRVWRMDVGVVMWHVPHDVAVVLQSSLVPRKTVTRSVVRNFRARGLDARNVPPHLLPFEGLFRPCRGFRSRRVPSCERYSFQRASALPNWQTGCQ